MMHAGILRHHHHSRRVLIQPMHDDGTADTRAQTLHGVQQTRLVALAGDAHPALRLIDDGQVLVFPQHTHGFQRLLIVSSRVRVQRQALQHMS